MRDELVVYTQPKSRVCEAIKVVRTNLDFASIDEEIKVILVTSSMPGEGKSFIAANLACAFAAIDKKVLLIDCDLRRGRQHQIFQIENDQGLSNLLIDDIKKYNNYIKNTKINNIELLPMGIIPPNPGELLSSKKNKDLLELLKKHYDIIILDCPPVNGLSDTISLTSIADTSVIVSAINITPIETLEQTKKVLEQVSAKVSGIIVNKIPDGKKNKYYESYYQ